MSSSQKNPRPQENLQKQRKDVDERFSRVQRDPRFWEIPEKQNKVRIDKRFQSMFHDPRFKSSSTVDKRGRPVSHSTEEDLRRFYQLSDEEGEEEEQRRRSDRDKTVKPDQSEPGPSSDKDDEDEGLSAGSEEEEDSDRGSDRDSDRDSDPDSGPDLARGKGNVETSSDEDEDEDEVEAILRREEEEMEHDWGELCKDAPRTEQVSCRLAVCNMDWDRIKAKDLLALFHSFCPKGGAVLSVKIFLSEFGRERLQQEQCQGPVELKTLPDDSEEDTEEDKVHREKMRDHQFKRLKYCYAVVECDSSGTAAQIYSECDGFEYESSSSVLDLRFIPEDMEFQEEPRDQASDVTLLYTPNLFTSSATSTSKVQLTWDETDHERVTALNRKFNKDELLNMDFRAYLASSSEEDGQEEEVHGREVEEDKEKEDGSKETELRTKEVPPSLGPPSLGAPSLGAPSLGAPSLGAPSLGKSSRRGDGRMEKYRALLKNIQEQEQQQRQDRDMDMEVTWVPGLKENAEQRLKKRLQSQEQRSPWEQYLQKKKEKKKEKKLKNKRDSEAGLTDDDDVPSDVDLNDPFFREELPAPDVKTIKKRRSDEEEGTTEEEQQRQQAQMQLLMEEDPDEARHKHFDFDRIVEQQNLSKNKRKRLKKSGLQPEEDSFKVNVADERFQAVFTSPLFNLDPSHPSFRRTKGTESLLQEKQRRRVDTCETPETATMTTTPTSVSTTTGRSPDPGLSQLVKSVKSKTQQFQARRKTGPL